MTTWTERSSPPSTVWLQGEFHLKKQTSNFYLFQRGFLSSRVQPNKQTSNFYFANGSYPGSYRFGKNTAEFVLIDSRT